MLPDRWSLQGCLNSPLPALLSHGQQADPVRPGKLVQMRSPAPDLFPQREARKRRDNNNSLDAIAGYELFWPAGYDVRNLVLCPPLTKPRSSQKHSVVSRTLKLWVTAPGCMLSPSKFAVHVVSLQKKRAV